MIPLPLESELQVVRLKMYLEKNPQEGNRTSITALRRLFGFSYQIQRA